MINELSEIINIAAGRQKSGLVLKNAQIVNVFTREIVKGDIALAGGRIAGIGTYHGVEEIDIKGRYAVPGLIDGHMHIESAMVTPSEFSRIVVPKGTTTVIADPHEIANVSGINGIKYILDQSKDIALDVFIMLPSCIPATPFDSPGARLDAEDLALFADDDRVLGLGELMDFRGVVSGRTDILTKIALFKDKMIDGHAPGLKGKDLNSYAAVGIRTEHECTSVDEMIEKLRLGFYILIREGSAARDLTSLVKGVNPGNMRRCIFCTDDRHLQDIVRNGHIDNNVRQAIKNGIDPLDAITMATLNAAECYCLRDRGAISPGYAADIVIIDDLGQFSINMVFKNGKPVSEQAGTVPACLPTCHGDGTISGITDTVKLKSIVKDAFDIAIHGTSANIMEIVPGSLITKRIVRQVSVIDGYFKCIDDKDPVKLAVLERHKATGRIGLGLLDGFGLRGGAIASTISHDSHNLIVAGDNDEDMLLAVKELDTCYGGITICSGGRVVKTLSLPVAGLMSLDTFENVNSDLGDMLKIAHNMGILQDIEPFMTLSFLALTVIPELRLTDKGLFDVTQNGFIDVSV